MALQFNLVGWVLCADVHLQFHVDEFFAFEESACDLMDASGLAWLDREVLGVDGLGRNLGFDGFSDLINAKAKTIRNHSDGFRQADVLDGAFFDSGTEFLDGEPGANFLLQGEATLGGVDNADRGGVVDTLRNCGQGDDELIHNETGINAGTHESHTGFLGGGVELGGEFRMSAVRVRQFFTSRNDAGADVETGEQLVHHLGEGRGSGVHDYVGGLLEDASGVAGDLDSPGSIRSADNLAEVTADLGRIGVDSANDFDGFFLTKQFHNRGTNGPDSVLNGTNFLFHVILRYGTARNARRGNSSGANYQAYWISETQAMTVGCVAAAIAFPHNVASPNQLGGTFMRTEKLSDADIQKHLQNVKGWDVKNGKLHKEFECKDFVTAFGKMTQIALVAEGMNHHPEWFNVWNKVVIELNTHSVQGISELDFRLAEKINQIFGA